VALRELERGLEGAVPQGVPEEVEVIATSVRERQPVVAIR
jgi:hypothetical protein